MDQYPPKTDAQRAINEAAAQSHNFRLNLDTQAHLNIGGFNTVALLMLGVKGVRKKLEAVFLPELDSVVESGKGVLVMPANNFEVPAFKDLEFPNGAAFSLLSLLSKAVVEVPTRPGSLNHVAESSAHRSFVGVFDQTGQSLEWDQALLAQYIARAEAMQDETQTAALKTLLTQPEDSE